MVINNEREITHPVLLCDDQGQLNKESIGWAKKPFVTSNLSGQFMRKKKWNYWCVFGQDAMFSATISNLDYAVVCFVYYLEYRTKTFYEKTFMIPFGLKCAMPSDVEGSVEVIHKDMGIFFIWNKNHVSLKVDCTDFGGESLRAEINIHYPEKLDTLNE
ncbi:DUF2804 family protein [Virgibacillus oceani]|uniref:DUF2804 domain-containing protein n=1 Tax=Virgibacillus oceani TaxID=1479511 RepID=A0A917HC43_9BACI|nr:DUF2804 family protein [Virgibacillus oceani]GGG74520.1 hypothetical protein GCM10011398_19010 [Virgibacillus oceani]